MPSITSWMRLEPRSRNAEMDTGLQARIYDPLWLLARQWQLGEFQGEDNGSPVMTRWRAEAARLTRYHSGEIAPNTRVDDAPRYDSRYMPLETLVERETVRPAIDRKEKLEKLRLAAEAGQHFLRMLDQQPLSRDYRAAFIDHYAFRPLPPEQRATLDSESLNFFDLMASRAPDGFLLYVVFNPTGAGGIVIEPALQIAEADLAEVEKAVQLWLQWYATLFSEPEVINGSWSPERMEYAFSIAARLGEGEHTLTAQEYYGGHLDWYAFDVNPEVNLGADDAITDITSTAIPAPVSFRGMSAARFWEFEDAQVDFGAVDAGPTDLLHMLLVEFALDYGNDWFVIPIELEVGSLYRSHSLVITDTFGVRTLIRPSGELGAPHSSWRMFQHSHLRGSGLTKPAPNLFFLPPSLLKSLESPPIEEVLFLRDEMANMAWAVERLIESPADRPLNRFEAYLEQKRRHEQESLPLPATASETLRYQLTTEVPDYWVPLLPIRTEQGLRLKRGAVLKTDDMPKTVHAQGNILESGQELSLFEEEVPREGIRVTRSYQFTRWIDGSSHVWVGRRKDIGRGEGSSGLRFDIIENGP